VQDVVTARLAVGEEILEFPAYQMHPLLVTERSS
jgi:hypothetical protein